MELTQSSQDGHGRTLTRRTSTSSASITSYRSANRLVASCRPSINASHLHTVQSIAAGLARNNRRSSHVEIDSLAPRVRDGLLALGCSSRDRTGCYLRMAFVIPRACVPARIAGSEVLELYGDCGSLGGYRLGTACSYGATNQSEAPLRRPFVRCTPTTSDTLADAQVQTSGSA